MGSLPPADPEMPDPDAAAGLDMANPTMPEAPNPTMPEAPTCPTCPPPKFSPPTGKWPAPAPPGPPPKFAPPTCKAPAPAPPASSSSAAASSAPPHTPEFEPSAIFLGARPDRVFKLGHLGLGYYIDTALQLIQDVRPQLPERWQGCELREERLQICAKKGAGLSLEACDFGFLVEKVATEPGQRMAAGEVIVAIEGRLLCGLSAPQMQASFLKRRVDRARLAVASFAEVKRMAERDPMIVETWDANYQRPWFFCKRTGRISWVYEELLQKKQEKEESAPGQVDLSNFLSHGFRQIGEPPKKKKKKVDEDRNKDSSDFARDEKRRWVEWNAGDRGGYTEQFLNKYKNCTSWVTDKEGKHDKRMKGSFGPGQGMEYMAKWTGSKNSFN